MPKKREGWTWLWNARKDHYFRNGRSLCGRWMCLGGDFYDFPDPHTACATCMKKLEKEKDKK